ncbi:MAG: hypothetical protein ACPL5F_12140 [Moorellaceae bacterium]
MSTNVIPPKPPKCAVRPEAIPVELKELSRWILWRYEHRDNRWSKVPCSANGNHINHLDSRNWLTFDQALEVYEKGGADGIGVVLGHGLAGLDLDNCIDESGCLKQWAKGVIQLLPASYAEISPSGQGVKVFFRTDAELNRREGPIELYSAKRFFTVTSRKLPNAPQELREIGKAALQRVAQNLRVINIAAQIEAGEYGPELQALFLGDTRDYPSHSEADLAFISLAIHRCSVNTSGELDFLMRLSRLYRCKWDETHDGAGRTYGEMTIERALMGTAEIVLPAETPSNGPEFPETCLVGLAGDFARLFSQYYEAPVEFWHFAFLTVLGHLLAGCITLASDLEPQPRLYTVLLGRSGVEKKSTAIRRTIKFFEDAGFPPHVLYGAGSAEGLGEALKDHSDLLLVADEFRALVSKTRIEGSVLGPMLTSLYELTHWDHRVKGKHLKVRNAKLSLLAASTVDSYNLVWDTQNLAIGLPNRLLIVPSETTSSHPFVKEVPQEEQGRLRGRLRELFEALERRRPELIIRAGDREAALPDTLRLHLSPEAEKLWTEWYANRPRDIHGTRLDTIGLRLAILLAVTSGNFEEVDQITIEKVCQILDWQYRMRVLHDPIDSLNTVAELEEKIRRVLQIHGGAISWRELQRKVNASRYGVWLFEQAVRNLERNKELRIIKQGRSKGVVPVAS